MRKPLPLTIAPGLFTVNTDRGSINRWKDGDHVRFRNSLPEKIGGWIQSTTVTFLGICRRLFDWQTLDTVKYIGIGTHLKLYIGRGGTVYDVTPIRASGSLGTDPFTMTNLSAVVSVNHTSHGNQLGDYVHFSGATAAHGITIDGEYTVTEVTDTSNYKITHSSAATSSGTGGGASVTYEYEIHIGLEDSLAGLGWGAGSYSAGTYGTPRSTSDLLEMCRIWSLDNWGEDLVGVERDGQACVWDSSVGTGTRAALITQAPSTCKAVLISPNARHMVALGAHDGVADNPMFIRWSSAGDYTDWTETETNTAGSHQLEGGNEIYCGIKTDREIVVLTDLTLASMVYQGDPYQFDIKTRGANGGLQGPNAAVEFNGKVYWMGVEDFFVYDGRINELPCDVRNHVFEDLNTQQRSKIYAGINRNFGEIWWLYASFGSDECDRYVLYKPTENHWSFGTLVRTAFCPDSATFRTPYAAGSDGYIYDHEIGSDDVGNPLASSLESYDLQLNDGEGMIVMQGFIPDFERLTGSVNLTLKGRKRPQGQQITKNCGAITSSTDIIRPKFKARQLALRLDSTALGDDWRAGMPSLELTIKGRK